MNDALKSGSVDAVLTVEPFITRIKNAGNGDVAALYAADLARTDPIISYVASRAFAEQHPDVIKAFRASIEEAAPIVNSDREKASQSIATFTKMPIDLVRLTRPDVSMPELKGSDFDHDNPRLVSHFGEDQEPWRIPSAKLKRPREVISGPPGPPQCGRTIPHTAFTLIKDAERPVLFQPFFNPTGGRVQATRRSKGKSRLRNNSVSGGEDKPRDCGDSVPPRFRPRFPSSLEDVRPPSHATLGTLETSCALGLYGGGITSWDAARSIGGLHVSNASWRVSGSADLRLCSCGLCGRSRRGDRRGRGRCWRSRRRRPGWGSRGWGRRGRGRQFDDQSPALLPRLRLLSLSSSPPPLLSLLGRALNGGWVSPRRRKALLERGCRRIGLPDSPASLNENQRMSDVVTSAAARAVGCVACFRGRLRPGP